MSEIMRVVVLTELLFSVQTIYAQTFQTVPMLIVASLWYLAVTTVHCSGHIRLLFSPLRMPLTIDVRSSVLREGQR